MEGYKYLEQTTYSSTEKTMKSLEIWIDLHMQEGKISKTKRNSPSLKDKSKQLYTPHKDA